jgi:hypothetical protein
MRLPIIPATRLSNINAQKGPELVRALKCLVLRVGHQSHVAGPLDGYGKRSLVLGAIAGYAAGKDLSALRNVPAAVLADILVIDHVDLVGAESADSLFPAASSFLNHLNPPIGHVPKNIGAEKAMPSN